MLAVATALPFVVTLTPLPADEVCWVFGQCMSQSTRIAERRIAVVDGEEGDVFGTSIVIEAGAALGFAPDLGHGGRGRG